MKAFEWGMIGLFSACLGCLALALGVFINILPICQTFPSPSICNGFVTLPIVYLGLAGILLSLASLDKIHGLNEDKSLEIATPRKRTALSSIRTGLGVFCYLASLIFVVWSFILFIPFDFEVSPNHFVQLGGNINAQSLPQVVVFEAAMFVIALLGTYLAPSIKKNFSKYTTVAVITGSALASLIIFRIILQSS